MILSITMGADYSFEVKDIEIWAPPFFSSYRGHPGISDLSTALLHKQHEWLWVLTIQNKIILQKQ